MGPPYLLEKVAGITLKVSVDAFFQTNTRMTEVLYGLVAREVASAGRGSVQTVAGGRAAPDGAARRPAPPGRSSGTSTRASGSIGLSLAGQAEAVLGIEAIAAAVEDAERTPASTAIENALFIEGDVAKVLRDVADGGTRACRNRSGKPDVIVVDPPRAGLTEKAIIRIGEVAAPSDRLRLLQSRHHGPERRPVPGLRLPAGSSHSVDMFPHTPHVECVGCCHCSFALRFFRV